MGTVHLGRLKKLDAAAERTSPALIAAMRTLEKDNNTKSVMNVAIKHQALNLQSEGRIEVRPLARISSRVRDDLAASDGIVVPVMDMTMNPQRRLHANNELLEIRRIAGRERVVPKLR